MGGGRGGGWWVERLVGELKACNNFALSARRNYYAATSLEIIAHTQRVVLAAAGCSKLLLHWGQLKRRRAARAARDECP